MLIYKNGRAINLDHVSVQNWPGFHEICPWSNFQSSLGQGSNLNKPNLCPASSTPALNYFCVEQDPCRNMSRAKAGPYQLSPYCYTNPITMPMLKWSIAPALKLHQVRTYIPSTFPTQLAVITHLSVCIPKKGHENRLPCKPFTKKMSPQVQQWKASQTSLTSHLMLLECHKHCLPETCHSENQCPNFNNRRLPSGLESQHCNMSKQIHFKFPHKILLTTNTCN